VIARLEGVLRDRTPTRVIVDVAGVGDEVLIPLSTFSALPDEGKTVALRIHTHMRDSAIQLYGFATEAERAAFELLLRASRVGPRLAQTVLSGIAPEQLLQAVRDGDGALLRRAPGVGAKMADRILVELRDRADELAAVVGGAAEAPAGGDAPGGARDQALSALLNLGYPKGQAERVLADCEEEIGPDASIEAFIRAALKRLGR
jgi:Holliday junction DNA helicase RuvA